MRQRVPRLRAWKRGTQTVFGAGPRRARVMFVGEQPGHEEDLAGEPFVGPAGKVLDRALEAAGVDRAETCVTNVVKHFKWVPKGKRRIHAKPNAVEITACLPWLQAELDIVKPPPRYAWRHRRPGAARTPVQGDAASRRVGEVPFRS